MDAAKIQIELQFGASHPTSFSEGDSDVANADTQGLNDPADHEPTHTPRGIEVAMQVCAGLALSDVPVACQLSEYQACPLDSDQLRESGGIAAQLDRQFDYDGPQLRHLAWNSHNVIESYRNSEDSYWVVKEETSFDNKQENQCHVITAVSPLYHGRLSDVSAKLSVICERLSHLKAPMKIWVTSDMGTNIVITPPDNTDNLLTLPKARHLAALCLLLEPDLYAMCHPQRRNCISSKPLSTNSQVVGRNWTSSDVKLDAGATTVVTAIRSEVAGADKASLASSAPNTMQMLTDIMAQKDMLGLKRALSEREEGTRNGFGIGLLNTFEFRYPEASLDSQFMSFWVALAARLVELASQVPEDFAKLISVIHVKAVSRKEASFGEWLEILGLSEWRDFCYQRQVYYSKCRVDAAYTRVD